MKLSEIVELLSPFLTSHGEKPILAVLGGSRGCNFESKDSDYDINFYYSSPSVLWESAIDTYGYVEFHGAIIHWYFHSTDLSKCDEFSECFYYSKFPLYSSDCFYAFNSQGEIYQKKLLQNAENIALYFLKKFFIDHEEKGRKEAFEVCDFMGKQAYGVMLISNHFGFINFSPREIYKCKEKYSKLSPKEKGKILLCFEKLKNFSESYSGGLNFS